MNPAFYNPRHLERYQGDRCIVSAGTEPHYFEQLHSTRLHCSKYAPEAWQLFYYGYPDGCPTQAERQYAFKIYALRRAVDAGFRSIAWLDCVFQPIASLDPLWKEIETHGWYVPAQGNAKLGNWCSDKALSIFGIDRDTAMEIQLVYSGLVGFRWSHPLGRAIWLAWAELYDAGGFDGPHLNTPDPIAKPWGNKLQGWCSDDARCQGHRHDESALSFILWKLKLEPRRLPFLALENSSEAIIGHRRELVVKE